MQMLPHIVRLLWNARVAHFGLVWAAMTLAMAVFSAWFIDKVPSSSTNVARANFAQQSGVLASVRSRSVFALLSVSAFLVGYAWLTVIWSNFTYYDNSIFTLYTLRGYDIAPAIWRQNGRFFPLGHQEFNVIRHFAHTIIGYHVFPIIELFVLAAILLFLDEELTLEARAGLAMFALITPGVMGSFMELIFTERNILLCIAVLLFSVHRFERSLSTAWAVVAVVSAQFMVYYKETAFLMLLGFAAWRLFLRTRGGAGGRDFVALRSKESRLDLCLAFVAAAFLVYYGAAMFPRVNMQYADQLRVPLVGMIRSYLWVGSLSGLLVAVFLRRASQVLSHRATPWLLFDGIAFGGVMYFAGFLVLRLFAAYYLAPVDLIAVLYVGRSAILSEPVGRTLRRIAIASLLVAVLSFEVLLSACSLFEDKNVVHEKTEVAQTVEAYLQNNPGDHRLYFPFATPVLIMQFVSYLSSRGLAIEESDPNKLSESASLLVAGKTIAGYGHCVDYEDPICRPGPSAESGDLVIILPDDEATLSQVACFRTPGTVLASYQPAPRIPSSLRAVFDHLRIVSPHSVRGEVPDRWLDASVSLWK